MAFTCSRCGYRTNEVKAGGAIAEKGKKHVLRVESLEDLSRDILKVPVVVVVCSVWKIQVIDTHHRCFA